MTDTKKEIAQLRTEISERNQRIAQLTRRNFEFGKRLKQARERAGLSRRNLGDALNITSNAYGLYETGQRDPSIKHFNAIADTLNVSVDWLLGRVDDTGNE